MGRHIASIALGMALSCGALGAAAQDGEIQKVPVDGVRDPLMKSYRAVVKGLDKFDDEHALAPAAPEVRFRILTNTSKEKCIGMCGSSNDRLPDASDRDFVLRIAGDNTSFPVPVSPGGLFSVPRSQAAYDDKADLMLDRKQGTYKILAEIRTPGLPDNRRRLGDLRLECKVQVAIVKEEIPLLVVALANSVLLSGDWCMATHKGKAIKFGFSTYKPLLTATLTDGDRRLALEVTGRRYTLPLADKSWADDALVELSFAEPEDAMTVSPIAQADPAPAK
jgi:hypothetical protein